MSVPLETEVDVTRSRSRVHTSIRIDQYLWQLFQKRVDNLGLSSCFVLEQLIQAWITGQPQGIPQARPVTVNMTVNYEVARARRAPRTKLIPWDEKRCHACNSPDIRERRPMAGVFLEGSCRHCGAEWLIAPGDKGS